ncbi:hypothetical protein A2U01_0082564, partial [Trifolium medium]|nr:hypothetical protein [Trifolium medium]
GSIFTSGDDCAYSSGDGSVFASGDGSVLPLQVMALAPFLRL